MSDNPTKTLRAKRSLHPGVKLKPPVKGARMDYWRAVHADPDTGRVKYVRLDPSALPTAKARQQWAIRKSVEIRARTTELEAGAPRATAIEFEDAMKLYYDNAPHLRDATLADYKTATTSFLKWTDEVGTTPDTLTRAKLLEFRAWIMKLPARRMLRGGKRGELTELDKRRSTITVNGDLRGVRIALGWLVSAERLPKLKHDDLKVALARFNEPKNPPEFLVPREIKKTLEACERHDKTVFDLTRNERRQLGQRKDSEKGKTPRHPTIGPFVLAAFLSGMRLDELCLLEWRVHIDLDAPDFNGDIIGQIKLRAEDTKTHHARTVSFDVSPLLRELFVALRHVTKDKGSVFGITYDEAQTANQRLRDEFNAPDRFTFQMARSTCSTFLSNAPAIYGAAAPFHSSKQLGHSQKVAEEHYTGLIKGIPRDIRTLEAAMQIEAEGQAVIDRVLGKEAKNNVIALKKK